MPVVGILSVVLLSTASPHSKQIGSWNEKRRRPICAPSACTRLETNWSFHLGLRVGHLCFWKISLENPARFARGLSSRAWVREALASDGLTVLFLGAKASGRKRCGYSGNLPNALNNSGEKSVNEKLIPFPLRFLSF